MVKQNLQRVMQTFRTRRRWQLHELNDWLLAALGVGAFLISGYWSMLVVSILPKLIDLTNQHGLTLAGAVIFIILGGLGVSIWFFGCIAARCHALLVERHFSAIQPAHPVRSFKRRQVAHGGDGREITRNALRRSKGRVR